MAASCDLPIAGEGCKDGPPGPQPLKSKKENHDMKTTTIAGIIAAALIIGMTATPAVAQNCLQITSPFTETFSIGITGSDGDRHSLSLERLFDTTRTASGSALLMRDTWYFNWGYTYPGGTLGWMCEIDPRTNVGEGALTQIFSGSTFNQTVECALTTCFAAADNGLDPEQVP